MADSTPANTTNRIWLRRGLLLAGPLVLLGAGFVLYLHGGRIVSSDNAYVHADKLTVTAEVGGTIKEVLVRDNQRVARGEVLFRLDDEPYRLSVAGAAAQLEGVRLDLKTLRSSYEQKLAAISEAQEQLSFAEHERLRQERLAASNIAPAADLEQAQHTAELARRHLTSLQQDAATVLASLGGKDEPDEKNPRFVAAQVRLDQAERDLRRTTVTAPFDGVVANIANLPLGKFLPAGQPGFSLVATDRPWIEANLKETELTYLKSGDPVTIEIDTYPHRSWQGEVAEVGPATGAEFALIPPQNASGNWIKTVQRIPVRVRIAHDDPERPLRAGMSAQVKIDTGHVRSWHDLTRMFTRNP